MQYYLLLLSLPFFYINFQILFHDYKFKKIPNKYLLYLICLLPFYYLGIFIFGGNLNFAYIFVQIFFSLIVSFLLYYLGVWSAGDAKYLLVLALFLYDLHMIYFVGNIALLTFLYLFLYFLYFYFWKCVINKGYAKSLYKNIYTDLSDSFKNFIKNNDGELNKKTAIYKILKWLLVFLIIFVSIRLLRLYVIQHLILKPGEHQEGGFWSFLVRLMIEYNSYFILVVILSIAGIVYGLFRLYYFVRHLIESKMQEKGSKINPIIIDVVFISLSAGGLLSYIIYEFFKNPSEISHNLKLIFTFYIFMYFLIRILKYSYRVTFEMGEQDYIKIEKLEAGEIVDKAYLINLFGTQKALGESDIFNGVEPRKYFESLENPINENTKNKLKGVFEIVNNYHKKNNTQGFEEIKTIRVFKTFSFGIYIFMGFLISFFIGNYIFKFLIEKLLEFLGIK